MRHFLSLVLPAISILTLAPLAAAAQGAPTISGSTSNLTSDPAHQTRPAVHADRVVWTDGRGPDLDVWSMQLPAGAAQAISESGGPRAADFLSDVGDRFAVWIRTAGAAGGGADVWSYEFATGLVEPVATGPEAEIEPSVSGAWVAYSFDDSATGTSRIRATNLDTGATIDVAGDATRSAVYPAISGTRIAYVTFDGVGQAVEVADISSGAPVVIFAETGLTATGEPDIDGDRVVYLVPSAGNPAELDLRVADLPAGTRTTLARAGDQGFPKLSGDFVAYEESGAILLSHVPTMNDAGATPHVVPSAGANPQFEDLHGGRLVYQALGAAGDFDVFLYEFTATFPEPEPPPPAGAITCADAAARGAALVYDETFVRRRGRPRLELGFFGARRGTGLVCVDNGDAAGNDRASSAWVTVNRQAVVQPHQLNQNVGHLETQVRLDRFNLVTAKVNGAPGSELRVRIYDVGGGQPRPPGHGWGHHGHGHGWGHHGRPGGHDHGDDDDRGGCDRDDDDDRHDHEDDDDRHGRDDD